MLREVDQNGDGYLDRTARETFSTAWRILTMMVLLCAELTNVVCGFCCFFLFLLLFSGYYFIRVVCSFIV